MPTKGRPYVVVRTSPEGIEWLDTEAERLGVTRSHVVRAALKHWAGLPERKRQIGTEDR